MAAHAPALQQLGLHKVWASLYKLALAGGAGAGRATPSRASQPQQDAAVVPHAAQQEVQPLLGDVYTLQHRVRAYKAKCKELKVRWWRLGGWARPKLLPAHRCRRFTVGSLAQRCAPCLTASLPLSSQATVVAMEGAAARWQAQAGDVEQGLALLRFRWA